MVKTLTKKQINGQGKTIIHVTFKISSVPHEYICVGGD